MKIPNKMTETKQKQAIFHTNGTIDPVSWEVLGVSAKDTKDPIGQFGTGLKYAIAVLVRSGHSIEIFSDGKHYKFLSESFVFRGKDFQRITCNGKTLPFTTDYGLNWKMWMAYRELVSNTMDEGGIHFIGEPIESGTSIVVTGNELIKCMENHNQYFIGDREPVISTRSCDIYEGQGTIFYKGVKVGEVEHGHYSYNIKTHLSLTEDRTFSSLYGLKWSIGQAVCKEIKDKKILQNFATSKNSFEEEIDWDQSWSDELLSVVTELWKTNPTSIGKTCMLQFKTLAKDADFEYLEMTPLQKNAVEKATNFLKRAGYNIDCPIKMVKNNNDNLIAYHYKGNIFLTERSFEKGLSFLVAVLFEESRHHAGYDDFSRSFQTYLIEEVIKQSAKNLNEFL